MGAKAKKRASWRLHQGRRILALVLAVGVLGAVALHHWLKPSGPVELVAKQPESFVVPQGRAEATTELADIARLNLECARDLPGAEGIEIVKLLRQLDTWAEKVRAETERHLYRFRVRPADYDHSEGYFRMLMMAVVLTEDFGIHYNPERAARPGAANAGDQFFANSADVFLHGLLGERRMGTCSSMPVLYVALGRRLGYPVMLVATKAHLFVRWEGRGERLNLEATGRGMNHYDDLHYRQWPHVVTEEEIKANNYLKAMSPAEELAVFMSIRGACLEAHGRPGEAQKAFVQAARLAPDCLFYAQLASGQALVSGIGGPASGAQFPPKAPLPILGPGNNNLAPATPADPNPLRKLP